MKFAALPIVWMFVVLPAYAQHGGHAVQEHPLQAPPAPAPAGDAAFPPPTQEERDAAFPDLGGMDMSAHMQEDPRVATLRVDRLEWNEENTLGWNLRASVGGAFDKLLVRSEAEKAEETHAHGSAELLWSHATGPWWDRVIGLRSDFGDGPSRQWLAIGFVGLAPYKFEIEATGYVGESGRLAARIEGEYEILLTNQWIFQPKLEANFYSTDDPGNRIGQGLSDAEFGLRLRYEHGPRFAPYAGYAWSRRFGGTADLVEAAGADRNESGWVAGLRFWF